MALAFPSEDHDRAVGMLMMRSNSAELSLRGRVRGCAVRLRRKVSGHRIERQAGAAVGLAHRLKFSASSDTRRVNACVMMPTDNDRSRRRRTSHAGAVDLRTGRCDAVLGSTPVGEYRSHAVSVDGRRMLSGGHDKSLASVGSAKRRGSAAVVGSHRTGDGCAFTS